MRINVSRASKTLAILIGMGCLGFTCDTKTVKIPDEKDDRPPLITMAHIDLGATAVATPETMTSAAPVPTVVVTPPVGQKKCVVPQFFVTAKATNPGGVQAIQLTITGPNSPPPIYDVPNSQVQAANGTATDYLSILGKNGFSGPTLDLSFGTGACPKAGKFHVHAVAINFHGQPTTMDYDIVSNVSSDGCQCN